MPFLIISARKRWSFRITRRLQDKIGVSVLRYHYYEPIFEEKDLWHSPSEKRNLPGIDFNYSLQKQILQKLEFSDNLKLLEGRSVNGKSFHYNNNMFGEGDAEALYSIIRAFKPKTVIEIGSGNSTIVARLAFTDVQSKDNSYAPRHICFEPFENPWLETIGAEIRREQDLKELIYLVSKNFNQMISFLSIRHTHLRPQGDVECEFLHILPQIPRGVFVHIHDIFTPYDYPVGWMLGDRRLWTEQYILEAFMSCNSEFEIVLALNDMHHRADKDLHSAFPMLAALPIEIQAHSGSGESKIYL